MEMAQSSASHTPAVTALTPAPMSTPAPKGPVRLPTSLDKSHLDFSEQLSRRVLASLKSLNDSLGEVRQSVAKIDSIAHQRLHFTQNAQLTRSTTAAQVEAPFATATSGILSPGGVLRRYADVSSSVDSESVESKNDHVAPDGRLHGTPTRHSAMVTAHTQHHDDKSAIDHHVRFAPGDEDIPVPAVGGERTEVLTKPPSPHIPTIAVTAADTPAAAALQKLVASVAAKGVNIDEALLREVLPAVGLDAAYAHTLKESVAHLLADRRIPISPHSARTHTPPPQDFHPTSGLVAKHALGHKASTNQFALGDSSDDEASPKPPARVAAGSGAAAMLAQSPLGVTLGNGEAEEERALAQAARHRLLGAQHPSQSSSTPTQDGYDSAAEDDDDDIEVNATAGLRRVDSAAKLEADLRSVEEKLKPGMIKTLTPSKPGQSAATPSTNSAHHSHHMERNIAIPAASPHHPWLELGEERQVPITFTFTAYEERPETEYEDNGEDADIPIVASAISAATFRAAEEEAVELKRMKAQLQAMRAAREAEKRAEGGMDALDASTAPSTDGDETGPWTIHDASPSPRVMEWHGGDAEWPAVQLDQDESNAGRFEAFALRIVYEAGRTGFEEAKDFSATIGTVIAGRYRVLDFLGSAAFSSALACTDLHTGADVCLKIIKNNKDYLDQSLDEIKLLRYINAQGDADAHHVLRLYDYFYHKEHLFLVTELLKDNLYEFQKFLADAMEAPYFTIPRIQRIARQTLQALAFIHARGLIHCDLKPENILIKSYSKCEVKVIDFGSSCFITDTLSSYVQSRSYRAPEVILGLPYGTKIDIWSLGCILCELLTGNVLFANDSIQMMLCRMQSLLENFPQPMLEKGRDVSKYFTAKGVVFERNDGGGYTLLTPKRTNLRIRLGTDDTDFLHFVASLLVLDPDKRPTAAQALQHPWFQKEYAFEPYVLPA